MKISTHKSILGLAALTLFGGGLVAAGCGSSRTATGTKPTGVSGGEAKGGWTVTDGTAEGGTCTPEEEGLCICVPGGFEHDGAIWDFVCCFSEALYVITCGDEATCNADTFACEEISGEGGSSEGGSGEGGSSGECSEIGSACTVSLDCCGDLICGFESEQCEEEPM